MSGLCAACVIGLQLATAHYGDGASDMRWATPGVYVQHPSGATFGAYRNSQGRGSVFAAWTLQTPGKTFALTAGAVTGYEAGSVLPLVVPSVRLPLTESVSARLMFVPPIAKHDITGAVTLAIEFELQ